MTTSDDVKAQILASIWIDHRGEEELADFFEFNDLGLPLAYAAFSDLIESTEKAQAIIDETFDMLLEHFGVEDAGYTDLDELLNHQ